MTEPVLLSELNRIDRWLATAELPESKRMALMAAVRNLRQHGPALKDKLTWYTEWEPAHRAYIKTDAGTTSLMLLAQATVLEYKSHWSK
mgnify:FL=1